MSGWSRGYLVTPASIEHTNRVAAAVEAAAGRADGITGHVLTDHGAGEVTGGLADVEHQTDEQQTS